MQQAIRLQNGRACPLTDRREMGILRSFPVWRGTTCSLIDRNAASSSHLSAVRQPRGRSWRARRNQGGSIVSRLSCLLGEMNQHLLPFSMSLRVQGFR